MYIFRTGFVGGVLAEREAPTVRQHRCRHSEMMKMFYPNVVCLVVKYWRELDIIQLLVHYTRGVSFQENKKQTNTKRKGKERGRERGREYRERERWRETHREGDREIESDRERRSERE